MKILFIGQKNNFKGYFNDYISDLLLHGLRELYGDNVIDYPGSWHLYKDEFKKRNFEKDKLWGKGFTLMNILDGFDSIDRNDLSLKIKKNYFDYIIYGSIRRNDEFLESALKYNNKVFFIDGEDDSHIESKYFNKGLYFKRELKSKIDKVFPINFAVPKNKIKNKICVKPEYLLSPLIPGRLKTYIYEDEKSYYQMYHDSLFSLTYKKAGWDCLRHYEILMNGSLPLFLDLQKCPKLTMTKFPKKELTEIYSKFSHVLGYYNPIKIFKKKYLNLNSIYNLISYKFHNTDPNQFLEKNPVVIDYKNMILNYTRKNLTTENLAKYLFEIKNND